jgi:hypothetical protein
LALCRIGTQCYAHAVTIHGSALDRNDQDEG